MSDVIQTHWEAAVTSYENEDYLSALDSFKKLASLGCKEAYVEIAELYHYGLGDVDKNISFAIEWYKKAALNADDIEGYLGLVQIFYYGENGHLNYSKAFSYARSALTIEDSHVIHLYLGRMYFYGEGTEKNIDTSKKHFKKAALLGNPFGYRYLGDVNLKTGKYLIGIYYRIISGLMVLYIGLRNPHDSRIRNY